MKIEEKKQKHRYYFVTVDINEKLQLEFFFDHFSGCCGSGIVNCFKVAYTDDEYSRDVRKSKLTEEEIELIQDGLYDACEELMSKRSVSSIIATHIKKRAWLFKNWNELQTFHNYNSRNDVTYYTINRKTKE